jgi:hypothetical protein
MRKLMTLPPAPQPKHLYIFGRARHEKRESARCVKGQHPHSRTATLQPRILTDYGHDVSPLVYRIDRRGCDSRHQSPPF